MKKLIALMVLAMGIGVIGDDIVKEKFTDIDANGMPKGWVQNKGKWAEPLGTVKAVKDGDESAVQLTSQGKVTPVYTSKMYDVKAGDIFEIEADAKGTGSINIGIYVYDAAGKWMTASMKAFKVTGEYKDYETKITVKDTPAKDDKPAMTAGKVRFVFEATANSDIFVKEFKADKED